MSSYPLIHYKFDGNVTNSGTGGSTYDSEDNGTITFDSTNKMNGVSAVVCPALTPVGVNVPRVTFNVGTNGFTMSFWGRHTTDSTPSNGVNAVFTSVKDGIAAGASTISQSTAVWYSNATQIQSYSKGAFGNNWAIPNMWDNNFHHYVITSSGPAATGNIYLDNVLIGSPTINIIDNVDQTIWIGGMHWGASDPNGDCGFNGAIDDFKIYESEVDANFVEYLYKIGNGDSLVGLPGSPSLETLLHAGATMSQLIAAGISIADLIAGGVSIADLIAGGVTVAQFLAAGYTVPQLISIGYPFSQISIAQLFGVGYSVLQIQLLGNYTNQQLLDGGLTELELINGGAWNTLDNANRLIGTTVNDYLDIQYGDFIVRNNLSLNSGDISVNDTTTFNSLYNSNVDISTNTLDVTNDITMVDTAALNVIQDISINGILTATSFADNSISTNAIGASVGGIDYENNTGNTIINSNVTYDSAVTMSADVLLNVDYKHVFNTPSVDTVTLYTSSSDIVTVTGPQFWSDIELSSTGQYQIASVGNTAIYTSYSGGAHFQSGNIWISNDYGENWTEQTVGGGSKSWNSVMISGDGSIMMVKAPGDNLYRSTDYGTNWSKLDYTWTDIPLGTGWTAGNGALMYMSKDGNMVITLYLIQRISHYDLTKLLISNDGGSSFVIKEMIPADVGLVTVTDAGTANDNTEWYANFVDSTKRDSISQVALSKNGKYIYIHMYTDRTTGLTAESKYDYFSNDYGENFYKIHKLSDLDYGYSWIGNKCCISNNGNAIISNKSVLTNYADLSGELTIDSNRFTNKTLSSSGGHTFGNQLTSLSMSWDGQYVIKRGGTDSIDGTSVKDGISLDYGATFYKIDGHVISGPANVSDGTNTWQSHIKSECFSEDNKYIAAVKTYDNIYVQTNDTTEYTTYDHPTTANKIKLGKNLIMNGDEIESNPLTNGNFASMIVLGNSSFSPFTN